MENTPALIIKDLRVIYKTIQAQTLFRAVLSRKSQIKKFEAIRGVSFTLNKGEIVGLIGKNGSGKSTLLRAVADIFKPDSGTIDTCGNSVSLMAIGIGFQKELSGREEIELELVGLCTDICVASNALLLKAFMPEVKISVDAACCAGVTPEKHLAALETMRSCQIQVTGA